MNDDQETRLRWPDDGAAVAAVQDCLDRMGRDRVVLELLPMLQGRGAVATWLLSTGHDPRSVRDQLQITSDQLQGMIGPIVEAMADVGETVIRPDWR